MSASVGLTLHARKRLQQRAIPVFVLDYLERFGASERCGGSERMYFDRHAKVRLARHLGQSAYRALERWLGVYAIVGDNGSVVTVGHQNKRFRKF